MPPALRPDDLNISATLEVASVDDDPTETERLLGKMEQDSKVSPCGFPSLMDFFQSIVLSITVGIALDHFGFFESHFWMSAFAITVAVELVEPGVNNLIQYVYPLLLLKQYISAGIYPSYIQAAMMLPTLLFLVGVPMSVCLHRYFSHGAFQTSRVVQLALAVVSTFAYQGGALWWSGKHVRHHHYCDQPLDPHSVVQQGYMYAFFLWTMDPKNLKERDSKYNNPKLFLPELYFLDRLHLLPPAVTFTLLENYFGVSRPFIVYNIFVPMLACRLVTLFFNVEYHPAHDVRRCKSIDQPKLLVNLVGEAYHDIHHKKPSQCKRSNLDIPYWITIFWMEKIGLIWNCR